MEAEPAADLAGVPDAFQRLWTPHRMVYINGENKPSDADESSCPFCRAPGQADDEGLIVARGESCYVVMNLYPYNPGHLLICPYRHVSWLTDLTDRETIEFTRLAQKAMRVLGEVSHPHGFNLGVNQGAVAGAGIAAHLHQHVVPRWQGDSNFMPVVAQTKALPQLLEDARALIAARWAVIDEP
ncbi:MAG: HIT domain-containing protein [Propioniciclava sp.]|uniref:HIT family protein n=1 Tax=Propioniciclava sp. TaxID=2038686 RepID=UPI0039E314A6